MTDQGQIVADEQHGDIELAAQLDQQIDDLRLDREIEGGDRLVGKQKARFHDQRSGFLPRESWAFNPDLPKHEFACGRNNPRLYVGQHKFLACHLLVYHHPSSLPGGMALGSEHSFQCSVGLYSRKIIKRRLTSDWIRS
jgi:hypothetical protein